MWLLKLQVFYNKSRTSEDAIPNQHQTCDTEKDHRVCDDSHMENMIILEKAEDNKEGFFCRYKYCHEERMPNDIRKSNKIT